MTSGTLTGLKDDLGEWASDFSDTLLQRNLDRVADGDTANVRHNAAMAICYRQLLAKYGKLHDHSVGDIESKDNQIYQNLQSLYELYLPHLEKLQGGSAVGVSTDVAALTLVGSERTERTLP